MHNFFAALHVPSTLGMALLAVLYGLKTMVGYRLLLRVRRWWSAPRQ